MGKSQLWRAAAVAATMITALGAVGVPAALAASTGAIDFESPAYATGSVNGQDDWLSTGAFDQEVVPNTFGYGSFGAQSLRISNAVTSGSFGDQTFSKRVTDPAGEPTSSTGGFSTGTIQRHFETQWDVASTVPGAEQPGLSVVASADRGDGARMTWVQMADTPTGLDVNFYDVQGTANPANFVETNIASGLSRSAAHTIRVAVDFLDGPSNDVVKVYVDGALRHTGTTWENYYRYDAEQGFSGNQVPVVNRVLYRVAGPAAPATQGHGFLIDNLTIASGPTSACIFTTTGTTMALTADCTTDHTILVPQGMTLNGNGHTITAIDPAGGHYLGAVVANAGTAASVTNVTVTTRGLQDVCDDGAGRLRGILLDGASGSITGNSAIGIKQGTNSGCQEGTGIEVRNAPFAAGGTDLAVTISGNTVTDYQKTGIIANGSVAATILDNLVTGAGPVDYIAQNGIQIGFGATGTVKGNTVSRNDYTPASFVACGVLYFDADGVKASANNLFANEKNQCNFGKGGGNARPSF
ncbi:MAG TPA: right-handed parallel beta-helix repeat-containing protein [Candidatus Limnocylindrales bacterium]